jgi:hypothetical protein
MVAAVPDEAGSNGDIVSACDLLDCVLPFCDLRHLLVKEPIWLGFWMCWLFVIDRSSIVGMVGS